MTTTYDNSFPLPFLLIHVGTNETAKSNFEEITSHSEALGRKLYNFGAQMVFSSLLPVLRIGLKRETLQVKDQVRRWCQRERFGFWGQGISVLEDRLLARDLTRTGENVFGHSMENVIRRASN